MPTENGEQPLLNLNFSIYLVGVRPHPNNCSLMKRKENKQKGVVTQKMVSFRCDLEVWEWLQEQPNKGRYINRLIADDMAR